MNKRNEIVKTLVTVGLQLVVIGSVLSIDPALATAQESDKIANAMSAGPATITAEATILDWPSDPAGDMIVLREGSNGWTCYTDWPATPGNDPMCLDQVWVEWTDAFAIGEAPNVTRPGLGYMLAGGSAASNTDPFAMEPAPGEDWMSSPPHVMFLYPDSVDLSQFTTDPTSGEPYVMWGGTPYEHIMMPVVVDDMAGDVEKAIANAECGTGSDNGGSDDTGLAERPSWGYDCATRREQRLDLLYRLAVNSRASAFCRVL